jgi:glycosyltransferase involved in cell wall biosynthesis
MRIGIVAYELEREPTGVGRYLEGLLGGVPPGSGPRFELFLQGRPFAHPLFERADVVARFAGESGRPWLWEQLSLPRLLAESRLDVLFSPSYSLPWHPTLPSVVTLHDLSFELLPHEFGSLERLRRCLLARQAARRASRVLVDRQAAKAELATLYGLAPARIGVVPLAVDARFGPEEPTRHERSNLAALGVQPPYWLFFGSLLERRRVDLVLAAFADLRAAYPERQLVIAGANRLREPELLERWVRELGLEGAVLRLGYVAEERVPALYRQAELAFYLSRYEGFGLPPLEALACGVPVVTSAGLGLDDLWPDYPFRAAALERGAVVAAAERALAAGRVAGLNPLARLSWASAAERWLAELAEAVRA